MNDSFLMRVLHCVTDIKKHIQSCGGLKRILIAMISDLDSANQFHHEIGPSAFGGAGIEHMRDIRMIHQRQYLSFGFEAGDDRLRIHSRFDYLDRHLPAAWLLLFGHENHSATAFTNLLQQLVAANPVTGFFARRPGSSFDLCGSLFEKLTGFLVSLQEGLDIGPQLSVSSTRRYQEGGALFSRKLHSFGK